MPCHPARARAFLREGKAAVYRQFPFTIILKDREDGDLQPIELKVDPGSKTSGIALAGNFKRGKRAIFGANLSHRGHTIKSALDSRRSLRRSRRGRKMRYRKPRFLNRTKPKGWLPPSLMSRVGNVKNIVAKLCRFSPVSEIAVETVRFDTQKMQNPEISGIEYQQGDLLGYEVREYLLEKGRRTCAYCDAQNIPLEVEHIVPRSKGGTNRISNLTLSCRPCNEEKGSITITKFLKDDHPRLKKILAQTKVSLKDTASVNATRYAIGEALKSFKKPISFWSGGRTKFNRCSQNYSKDHWIDAVCVGESGSSVWIAKDHKPLLIKAEGRGSRQKCLSDQYGFPRTSPKEAKRVYGFQTGDLVKANVSKGKKVGVYRGRVAVRTTGNFNVKTKEKTVQGISYRYCTLIQRNDGYSYGL
jgi:5-methylcytosine-specific restriction endonuclease McrA